MYIGTIIVLVLSLLAVASAVLTIASKNPLKSAMALVFHFFMLAGIYLTLTAQFLAVMQVIVYAGAIMILVIFVIMLLNVDAEKRNLDESRQQKLRMRRSFAITIGTAMLILILSFIIFENTSDKMGTFMKLNGTHGTVQAVGKELYTNYLVPLEIIGILLLSAIVGAVALSKKKLS